MTRLICISDVHGHLKELNCLLEKIELRPDDRLVFLGDLVDRGPDSLGVVRRVRELLAQYPESTALLGNHESSVRQWLVRPNKPGRPEWLVGVDPEEVNWLTELPVYTRDVARNLFMVHGGLYPRYFQNYPAVPAEWDEVKTLSKKHQERIRRFKITRYCNPDGNVVQLGEEKPEDYFWADRYDGSEGYVVFGHEPFNDAPRYFPHALGLDSNFAVLAAIWDQEATPTIFKVPHFVLGTAINYVLAALAPVSFTV
jgi:predicted phosphodiesterase